MKIFRNFLLIALCVLLAGFVPAQPARAEETQPNRDFTAELALDLQSETAKVEAMVKTFIDGDTVHFTVDESVCADGVLKARFLAVDTPETSGKVEEFGKKASDFTKEKLSGAAAILLESDDAHWNLDSTGDRHLVWVWYQPEEGAPYRCLNIEILQNGLAAASATANNRYGHIASNALGYAMEHKLHVFSGEKDPDFYYGDAIELTLRELRMHAQDYVGKRVAFSGVVTLNDSNSVYVEDYDEETGRLFGISVYYGYGLSGQGLSILKPGNEVRIVGAMQFYEAGGTYQVSDLKYRAMKPDDPNNIQKLSEGHSPAYLPMTAAEFASGTVELDGETYPQAEMALSTSVQLEGLFVTDGYQSEESGEMTLFCQADGASVQVRTAALKDEAGERVTVDDFLNKTISVRGIVDFYDGKTQVKALSMNAIAFAE